LAGRAPNGGAIFSTASNKGKSSMSSNLPMSSNVSTLPAGALAALVVLALVAITLDMFALLDLYRRPTSQVVFANKWIWVPVILLVEILGAIIYLVAGRRPAVLTDDAAPSESTSIRTESVADALYGPRDGVDRR
jgi:Phospholipase_D-nuclease N-terminal